MSEKSIRHICQTFWELENNLSLFKEEINGVKFWELVRYEVYNEVVQRLGVYNQAHTTKDSLIDKVSALPKYLFNSITKNPFLSSKPVDVLVFDHERKIINESGLYKDIYTEKLITELYSENIQFEVIEDDYLRKHWSSRRDPDRSYNDYYYLTALVKRLNMEPISIEDNKDILLSIESELNLKLGVAIDLSDIVKKHIERFLKKYDYYHKLLSRKRPTRIYVVVSYVKQSLIAAAKDLGIEVIEIQHGVITRYHMGYSYPNVTSSELEYFPDKLWVFGSYWKDASFFPINQADIISYGFPYLEKKLKIHVETPKKQNQIIVLSQGTIGEELSRFIYKVAKIMPEYEFIYKLHPGEFDRWRNEYEALVEAHKLDNFTVMENTSDGLHKYLAESEFQIGVYSTAIFEGLAFDCKTVLIDLPGIEYMDDLIESDIVNKISISNYELLPQLLNNHSKEKRYERKDFFENVIG